MSGPHIEKSDLSCQYDMILILETVTNIVFSGDIYCNVSFCN